MATPQFNQWPPAPMSQADAAVHDEVRTIFVLGFPPDVKERELQNLLRWWPGYEASQMNFKCDQPMGFSLFSTAAMAVAARDALQNLVFDADTNSILRAEMAKKNLFVKRGVTGDLNTSFDASKRMRTGGGDYSPAPFPAPYPPAYPAQPMTVPAPAWGPQTYVQPQPQYEQYAAYPAPQASPVAPSGYAPVQNTKDNPPCNTLFIGNLGEAVNETELRSLFSGQPGFRQMKILRQGKNTVCFIEFLDVNSSMLVHANLQGAVLSTSDRGGMRIQHSELAIIRDIGTFQELCAVQGRNLGALNHANTTKLTSILTLHHRFSKNPYGRKREGAVSTLHDPGVQMVTMIPMAQAVEANRGVEHTAPPSMAMVSIIPQEQAAV